MSIDELTTVTTFAASWAIIQVSHNLSDLVTGQTDWQAANKPAPSPDEVAEGVSPRRGWAADLAHVAQYHLTLIVLGGLAWLVLPLHWSPLGVVVALVWSAASHALLDRRWPVRLLLRWFRAARFAELRSGGMNGLYLADQALHGLALVVAAAMLAVIP